MSIIVSPDEINDALNTKRNALDVLKIQIDGEKSSRSLVLIISS